MAGNGSSRKHDHSEGVPLGIGEMHVSTGDHIGHFYETREEWAEVLGSFLKAGLKAGEKCVYLMSPGPGEEQMRTELAKAGIDVDKALGSGQLVFHEGPNDPKELRDSLEKLQLNDAALHYEPESSVALGFGFRCGFLGLLHMDIVQERLEREFDLDLITTVPNVEYHAYGTDGSVEVIENPTRLPTGSAVDRVEEPYVKARITAPADYIGGVMKLGQERRGEYLGMHYLDPKRVQFDWEFPLAEIILDFYDRLKTVTRGYAAMDYELSNYRRNTLVKLDMLINGEPVDAFSVIIHRDKAYAWGRKVAEKLKELIPRQLFEVVIQAAIGTKVIARQTVRPLRKNVTAKCYGGDVTRKRKLLEKQKEGKKRMKQVGTVEIPQEAFLAVLQVE